MSRMTLAGHSAHAIINDWPIGLLTTGFVFDTLHLATNRPALARTGYHMMASAFVTGFLAAATGIAEYKATKRTGEVKRLANRHAALNVMLMAVMGINLLGRRKNRSHVSARSYSLSVLGNALTFLSAWYGGEMVFGHGVRVRDQHINEGDKDLRLPGDHYVVETLQYGIHA